MTKKVRKPVIRIAAAAAVVCAAAALWLLFAPAAEETGGDVPEASGIPAESKGHTGQEETPAGDVLSDDEETSSGEELLAEEPRIDPEVWEASLDQAITEVIWANHDLSEEQLSDHFCCETHRLLDIRNRNGESVTVSTGDEQEIIVYAVVMIQVCDPLPEEVKAYARKYYAEEMTFSVETEAAEDGTAVPVWTLEDFWKTPGNNYYNEFRTYVGQRFPEDLAEEAATTYTRQNTLDWLVSSCNDQAIAYAGIDAEQLVEGMFEAMTVPIEGEDQLQSLLKHPEYIYLHFYGDHTLRYAFREFLKGGQEGAKAEAMFIVLTDLISIPYYWMYGSTGQERFDNYLASARELEEEQGMEWLEENEPAMWRFLQKLEELQPY